MSETSGRCRREIDSIDGCAVRHIPGGVRPRHVLADAIDRLAADVAEIKAKADSVTISLSPEDVAHFVECEKAWVSLAERQRDEAIRKRDEALAEVERLRGELAARPAEADTKSSFVSSWILRRNAVKGSDWSGNGCPACGGSMRIWFRGFHDWTCLCAWPEKRAWWKDTNAVDEDWLNELVWRWKIDAANSPKIPDSSPAASQPAAPPPGWLTEEERRVLRDLLDVKWANVFERVPAALLSILSRAGSPPVVEVPAMRQPGPMTIREKQIHVAYRDAMDAAGVAWKEVGRE